MHKTINISSSDECLWIMKLLSTCNMQCRYRFHNKKILKKGINEVAFLRKLDHQLKQIYGSIITLQYCFTMLRNIYNSR